MSDLRTANLLGAIATDLTDRLEERLKLHANRNDSAAADHADRPFRSCSNVTLSQALNSHPATVWLVDKLEVARLVTSWRGSDQRYVALYLTQAGRKRLASY